MKFISEEPIRVDKFLAEQLGEFSRAQLQRLIKEGDVLINDKPARKPSVKLKEGDKIFISKEVLTLLGKGIIFKPEDIPLDIIYEDKDVVVINKQAGLLVHPTASQPDHTLASALLYKYPGIKNVGENPLRPGIAHRLDKDTSGLLIITKNQKAFEFLKEQFLNRSIQKKYLALVEGIPEKKEGVINYSIRPSKINRLKKIAIEERQDKDIKSVRTAETHYQVKKSYEVQPRKITLLEASPKTGRTHQIRVHLSAIGHPVVGDKLYGSKSGLAARQMLHAYSLKFKLLSGKELELEIGMPEDMKKIIEKYAEHF